MASIQSHQRPPFMTENRWIGNEASCALSIIPYTRFSSFTLVSPFYSANVNYFLLTLNPNLFSRLLDRVLTFLIIHHTKFESPRNVLMRFTLGLKVEEMALVGLTNVKNADHVMRI